MCSQFMLYFRFYKFVSNWMLYNHVQYRAKSTQLIHTYYFHDYVCVYNHINFYLILFSAFAFFARSLHLLLRVCEILWFGCFFWLRTFFCRHSGWICRKFVYLKTNQFLYTQLTTIHGLMRILLNRVYKCVLHNIVCSASITTQKSREENGKTVEK